MPPPHASGDLNSHPERPGDLDLLTLELVCNVTHAAEGCTSWKNDRQNGVCVRACVRILFLNYNSYFFLSIN